MDNDTKPVMLSALDRADLRDVLEKAAAAFEEGAADARRHDAPTLSGHLRARAERFVQLAVLFAVLLLIGCAADHDLPRGDGPPLYVHLCDGMPAADQLAWGDAAGVINASLALALEEPALWVGHGMPVGCDTVYVCPSSSVRADVELRRSPCTTTVRYAPDAAQQVAAATYEALLEEWPPAAAWHVEIGEAVLRGGT